ncbi:MAG TPA: ATP-grasp domain-containing protein [Acidimicrobiia bacterium]|nr:ATP-grasp domain-containing protein [Acidimicrobiia bacterium]
MPTAVVVLPSTTYRAADFVAAAEALGVGLIVASEGPAPIDMGDGYLQIDCTDPARAAEAIVALGDRIAIDGVVAADDAGVVVAALTGETLGLRSNPPFAAAATRSKAAQRRAMEAAEVPQPRFAVIDPGDDAVSEAAAIGYPLVIKPVDRAAGQGVMRVDRVEDLMPLVERLRRIVGESAQLVAESFMPGVEVAVEGIVNDGVLAVLAIFDKPDAGDGPFFPETILVTPSRLPAATANECERVAQAALDAIGITHGPVHVELMVEGSQVRVIEVAARSIGGLCSKSLNFGLMGTTLETLILRNALGMDKPELHRESVASGVLMVPIPRNGRFVEVRNTEAVRGLPYVTGMDITVKPGRLLEPPPEGDRYLGFVYARAATPEDVETSLRKAEGLLEVVVE